MIGHFLRRERSGAAALEFALVAPLFFGLVFSTFEAGWMMTKSMMLGRSMNIAIRLIRVGSDDAATTQAELKKQICANTMIIPDCVASLTVEMSPIASASDFPTAAAACVDRGSTVTPVVAFTAASRAMIMFVRACIVTDPFTPGIGVALDLPKDSKGGYSLVSTTAFMSEPG